MGSEAQASEMNILIEKNKKEVAPQLLYSETNEKYHKTINEEHYSKGFWYGFTTGAIFVTVLYAVITN